MAETTEESKTTTRKSSKTEFVLHHPAPGFTVREISKEAWASIGINHETVEWNPQNRYRIPASEFSAKALNYLKGDDGFEIVEE